MTNNRTNEPNQNETKSGQEFGFTEAQVEAAARALADADNHLWSALSDRMREKFRGYARAALVAAAGAAPQDEPSEEWLSWCRKESCVHRHWRSGGMPTHRRGDDCPTPGNHAPVLPSSTVDEDKLARLLCEKNYLSPDGKPTCAACRDKAHEVAEWLKEQGR